MPGQDGQGGHAQRRQGEIQPLRLQRGCHRPEQHHHRQPPCGGAFGRRQPYRSGLEQSFRTPPQDAKQRAYQQYGEGYSVLRGDFQENRVRAAVQPQRGRPPHHQPARADAQEMGGAQDVPYRVPQLGAVGATKRRFQPDFRPAPRDRGPEDQDCGQGGGGQQPRQYPAVDRQPDHHQHHTTGQRHAPVGRPYNPGCQNRSHRIGPAQTTVIFQRETQRHEKYPNYHRTCQVAGGWERTIEGGEVPGCALVNGDRGEDRRGVHPAADQGQNSLAGPVELDQSQRQGDHGNNRDGLPGHVPGRGSRHRPRDPTANNNRC